MRAATRSLLGQAWCIICFPGMFILGCTDVAAAQTSSVEGLVFDSTAMRPLSRARVALIPVATGGRTTIIADSLGRFAFRDLALGDYLIQMQHARAESLSVETRILRVSLLEPSPVVVQLGLPSIATLIGDKCGAERDDSMASLIIGSVWHEAHDAASGNASVRATWTTLYVEGPRVAHDSGSATTTADAYGRYFFCGAPSGSTIKLQAWREADSSGVVTVSIPEHGLAVRPLQIGSRTRVGTTQVGSGRLGGTVTDDNGIAVSNAELILIGVGKSTRSSTDGSFRVDSLPGGTMEVSVRAVGFLSGRETVDIRSSKEARLTIVLSRLAQSLDATVITSEAFAAAAAREGLERRRRTGIGFHLDAAALNRVLALSPIDYLRSMPGVFVEGTGVDQYVAARRQDGKPCRATLLVDGVRFDGNAIELEQLIPTNRVSAVEVYPRGAVVPSELPNSLNGCAVVVFWSGTRTP